MTARKILIVDDDPDILMVLGMRLRPEGCEICVARDGEEAFLKAKKEKPDLIILDVLLPKMTGYEVLLKIREDKELEHIPVIVISAKGIMEKFFLDLPHTEFLAKPYDSLEFSEKVHRLVASTSSPDGSSFF